MCSCLVTAAELKSLFKVTKFQCPTRHKTSGLQSSSLHGEHTPQLESQEKKTLLQPLPPHLCNYSQAERLSLEPRRMARKESWLARVGRGAHAHAPREGHVWFNTCENPSSKQAEKSWAHTLPKHFLLVVLLEWNNTRRSQESGFNTSIALPS